jgi:UDP-N-acetyl-D-galactosamine dehydrogenase
MTPTIAVVGLGYVGLPLAVAFARKRPGLIGFDIDQRRIAALKEGIDWTREVESVDLKSVTIDYTSDIEALRRADVFIICVPTPINEDRTPDLRPLQSSSEIVGKVLRKGGVAIYEATVYPGLTENYCAPILEANSGMKAGVDFHIGYSPERINPGDKEHTFTRIKKVVSADDAATTDMLAKLYGEVVEAGIHVAPSIMVAEAAKVIENTQRDINIALMNELALICDRLGIRTKDVLDAARTKWNFLPFAPGLVGGHCIGVDPYYLTARAQQLGYNPEVILAGRRINDSMGVIIAQRLVRLLSRGPRAVCDAKVGILGVTFKENIPDIRNSRIPDITKELGLYGIGPKIHDPYADKEQTQEEYGLSICGLEEFHDFDAVVLAVPHACYLRDLPILLKSIRPGGILIDVKSAIAPADVPASITYWSL